MKKTFLAALALVLISLWLPSAHANQTCNLIMAGRAQRAQDPLLFADLLEVQREESAAHTAAEITAMNNATLARMKTEGDAVSAPTVQTLRTLHSALSRNPVVADQMRGKYDQCDVQIGFCFGRAAFVDIALRKLGYSTNNIRKVWSVGEIGGGGTSWAFHVATAVHATDGQWYVIDNLVHQPISVEAWFKMWVAESKKPDLRLYVTDPNKFSVSLGPYDRVQMGLDAEKKEDWYRGFFKDMLIWFDKEGGLASLGLNPAGGEQAPAPRPRTPIRTSIGNFFRHIFN